MTPPDHRRFTLLDAIVLIAATAAGLGLAREGMTGPAMARLSFEGGLLDRPLFYGTIVMTALLAAWSPAALILAARGPRQSWKRLARQSGFLLNASALAAALVITLRYGLQAAISTNRGPTLLMHVLSVGLPSEVGLFVAGAAFALLLLGRPGPAPAWIDRLAFALGISWVMLTVLTWARFFAMIAA